ncbi:MAG TPA: hypothetical protein VGK47_14840 [Nitrososphaeraceae archaeon]
MNDYGFISSYDTNKESGDYGFIPQNPTKTEDKQEESLLKQVGRWLSQAPLGFAQATVPGIVSNLAQMIGVGSALDEEELEQLEKIHAQQGIPFDREAYMQSLQQASEMFPTPSNIARMTEEATGLPLTPKTKGQKLLQLGVSAGKFNPGAASQKLASGGIAAGTAYGLEEAGVPEPLAEMFGLGASGAGRLSPEIEIGKVAKPSGLPARQFEKLQQPRIVSEKKIGQINKKLEQDFKSISEKIIEESPIGETAENLRNDPTFKQSSRELLNQAQQIADSIPESISSKSIKKELADTAAKKVKGYALSEYDKKYMSYMKDAIEDIITEKATAGELVEQYRKNNSALGEYFEPGASKASNRAKRDALLDQNRAIAQLMEKSFPESELVPVFKEGNSRWSKIMDVETIDDFVNDIFGEKINYKKMHDFFDKEGYSRIFKRALGEKGYTEFEQLMKDMLTSENAYKMLNIGKKKGFFQHVGEMATAFVIHPGLAKAKGVYDLSKYAYRSLINSMLDKPEIGIKFNKAIKEIKKGKFAEAEKDFDDIQVEILSKEKPSKPIKEPETLETKTEKIEKPIERISGREEPKVLEASRKQIEYKEPEKIAEKPKLAEQKPIKEKPIESKEYKSSLGLKSQLKAKYERKYEELDLPDKKINTTEQASEYIADLFPLLPKKDQKINVRINIDRKDKVTPYVASIDHPLPEFHMKLYPGSPTRIYGYGKSKTEAVKNLARSIYDAGTEMGDKFPEAQFANYAPIKSKNP